MAQGSMTATRLEKSKELNKDMEKSNRFWFSKKIGKFSFLQKSLIFHLKTTFFGKM